MQDLAEFYAAFASTPASRRILDARVTAISPIGGQVNALGIHIQP
jgi:hypothetical protein